MESMRKLNELNSHKIVNIIFLNMNNKERKEALQMIDEMIIANLGIEKNKLPWLNECSKKEEVLPWVRFLHKMRITYARLYQAAWDESIVKH